MTIINRIGTKSRTAIAAGVLGLSLWFGAGAIEAKKTAPATGRGYSIEDALPAKCLMQLSFDGLEAGAQCKNTAVAQIWNDPQMQAFAAPLKKMAEEIMADTSEGLKQESGLSMEDIHGLLNNGFTLQVNDVEIGEHGPENPDITLAIDLGGKKEAIQRLGDLVEKSAQDATQKPPQTIDVAGHQAWSIEMQGQKIAWTFADQTLLACTNLETMAGILNRMKAKGGAGGLGENAEYVKVSKKVAPAKRAMAQFYLDLHGVLAKVKKQASGSAQFNAMFDAMGLDAMGGCGYALSQEGAGFADRMYLSVQPGKTSIYNTMKHSNDPLRSMSLAPEKSFVYSAGRTDISGIITKIYDAVISADPDAAEEIKKEEARLDERVGLSLRKDVLPTIGQEFAFWMAPAPFGGLLPEIGIAMELRDPQKFEESLAVIAAKLGPDAAVKSFTFGAAKINYLDMGSMMNAPGAFGPGPKPAWTVDGNFLVMGITPQALKNSLVARRQQRATIAVNRDFTNGMAQIKNGNPNAGLDGASYVDLGSLFVMVADTLGHAGQCVNVPANMPIDMTQFPTTDVFQRHLFGMTMSSTYDPEGGVISEVYSPLGYVPSLALVVVPAVAATFTMSRERMADVEPMPIPEDDAGTEHEEKKEEKDGDHR